MQRHRLFLFLFCCISAAATAQTTPPAAGDTAVPAKAVPSQLQYFIIKAGEGNYGYSIYANGRLYIQQTTIPVLAGNRIFTDTAQAGATARLVLQKMREGQLPPALTTTELKKIGIE